MKKILALVLALVMTMSLATISSGAAFTDAEKVQYTDAVNTMSALGVMGGYADGSIRPQADVTRGAAAKMVAMVATTSNPTTIGYYAGTSSFADVPASHTFADAVAFCVARGIVAGYGNGYYGVGDNVKGWAVAKMVLVAMGYDAEAYGMEGTGSALNTITLASSVGLFDGMAADFVATEAASREECAQIIYNALSKATVEATMNSSTGVVTYAKTGAPLITKYGVTPTTGQTVMAALVANAAVKVVANQSNTLSAYTTDGTSNFNVETGADMLGHNVVMLKKSATPKYDANGVAYFDVYGTADLTVETSIYYGMTAAEVKAALEASGYYLPYNFSTLSFATQFTNGSSSSSALEVVASANTCKDGNTIGAVTLLGTKNSDGTVTPYGYVVADAMFTDKVSAIGTTANAETITLASAGALQNNIVSDVVNEYAGIAEGDYVTYTVVNGCYNLVKCTTVEGTVSRKEATTGANAYQLTVNGQVLYPFYGTDNAVVTDEAAYSAIALATPYTFYLASDGSYFAAVAKVDTTKSDMLYVAGTYPVTAYDTYGDATVSTYAQCVALDGTVSNVLVGVKVGSAAQQGVTSLSTGFVTFSLSSTAADAKLGIMTASPVATVYNQYTAPVIADALAAEYDYDSLTASGYMTTGSGKAYINAATKFIFVNGSKASIETKVIDGAINANVASGAKALVTKDADNNWIVKAVIAGTTYTNAGATATDYLYVADAQSAPALVGSVKINNVDTNVYEYTVYDAATGAKKTINAIDSSLSTGFFSYSIVEGVYDLAASAVAEATAPAAGAYYAEAFASKFGTKITTTQLTDMEAGKAIVVDTRTAAEIAASQVAALTSVDAINAAKLNVTASKTATFDCYVVANTGVTVIFVTAVA